jgi:death-on-curing protein
MIRYLTKDEVLFLHNENAKIHGTSQEIKSNDLLESALYMPKSGFEKEDRYVSLFDKASAYLFFLISNHPFVDGNKRIGQKAMESFLILNGFEIKDGVENGQYSIIMKISSGSIKIYDIKMVSRWIKSNSCEFIKSL